MADFEFDFDDVEKYIDKIALEFTEVRDDALDEIAEVTKNEIESAYNNKLIDPTGELASSVGISKKADGHIHVYIKKGSGKRKNKTNRKNDFIISKALYNEFGTVNQIARPIFFPIAEKVEREKLLKIVEKNFDKLGE